MAYHIENQDETHHQDDPNQSHTVVPAYSQHDPEAGHATKSIMSANPSS